MCLAIPAQVVELRDGDNAVVDLAGVRKEISLALVDDVAVLRVSEYGFTDLGAGNDTPAARYIGCVVPVTIYVQRSV